MNTPITVDKFDLLLLAALQADGLATNSTLGASIHMSTSQVSRRIMRLQQAKVIDHYSAVIEPAIVGLDVMAFTEVTLDRHDPQSSEKFEREVVELENVLDCYLTAGPSDYTLRIVAPDLIGFSQFMANTMLRIPGVTNVKSTIVLRKLKSSRVLPLEHLRHPAKTSDKVVYSV